VIQLSQKSIYGTRGHTCWPTVSSTTCPATTVLPSKHQLPVEELEAHILMAWTQQYNYYT